MDCEERGAIWPLLDLEIRGLSRVIKGYAIVFNRPSERLGWFVEEIAPAAVNIEQLKQSDVRALIDHEPQEIIGRLSAGTLRTLGRMMSRRRRDGLARIRSRIERTPTRCPRRSIT